MEQSECTHLPIKFSMLYGDGSWCPQTITIVHQRSLITDDITHIIIVKKFETLQDYQHVTQRHEVHKCYWRNGANQLPWHSCHAAYTCEKQKYNKEKCNTMRDALISHRNKPSQSNSSHFIKTEKILWDFLGDLWEISKLVWDQRDFFKNLILGGLSKISKVWTLD